MSSRQRSMLILAAALMVPFVALTYLSVDDLGVFASSYLVVYLAFRLVSNPRLRVRVDVLGYALLVGFVFFTMQHVTPLLGGG
ncbi:MAG TPA: hypothetical protein VJR06_05680 [Nitrososphaerales archaeon]|nr:hypothetical protein [Nitrososphaerales archaeon]